MRQNMAFSTKIRFLLVHVWQGDRVYISPAIVMVSSVIWELGVPGLLYFDFGRADNVLVHTHKLHRTLLATIHPSYNFF